MKRIKKVIASIVLMSMMLSMNMVAMANENVDLKSAYERVVTYANENSSYFDMEYEDFRKEYQEENYQSLSEYESVYYDMLKPQISEFSSRYYYNTGTTCPAQANYSRYNLLDVVEKGDLIYESKGGFGVTGHIAIVEGIYTYNGKQYIRMVEAIDDGVVRSILDDTRVDEKDVTIMRVMGASNSQKGNAVNFCVGEIGSSYKLDFAKDRSSAETDWYCSELVWAGYINNGIDIESTGFNEPGVTPRDIKNSKNTYYVAF